MRQTVRRHGRDNRIFGADPIPPGQWIYVGSPGDPGVTDDSPAFQNGWTNAGGGLQRLRFRLTNEDQLEIQGAVAGGTLPVVTTLPDLAAHFRDSVFWPAEERTEVGTVGTDGLAVWSLAANGELSVVDAATGGIVFDTPNTGGELEITTTGDFIVEAARIVLEATASPVTIEASNDDVVLLADANVEMTSNFGDIVLNTGDDVRILLSSLGQLIVYNSTADPIFRIDEDGTVHMKAGASTLYDL